MPAGASQGKSKNNKPISIRKTCDENGVLLILKTRFEGLRPIVGKISPRLAQGE